MPSDNAPISITHIDMLGMIAMQAQIITSQAVKVAGGEPFPNPRDLQMVIDRMSAINASLIAACDRMQPTTTTKN